MNIKMIITCSLFKLSGETNLNFSHILVCKVNISNTMYYV